MRREPPLLRSVFDVNDFHNGCLLLILSRPKSYKIPWLNPALQALRLWNESASIPRSTARRPPGISPDRFAGPRHIRWPVRFDSRHGEHASSTPTPGWCGTPTNAFRPGRESGPKTRRDRRLWERRIVNLTDTY